jgi:hypothetical protein
MKIPKNFANEECEEGFRRVKSLCEINVKEFAKYLQLNLEPSL